ncbi:ATPase, T2SS/T4P/T4SS family (plasmid) [Shewanella xiamenensis]|uniref:ATPase, T2SS/T4P/T4SS family n=1 Tax=Shewanella xiamenensis TaxID=332186 RepID=A0ABT6UFP6_9GAMM|nr:ATPase, T2SS/T4P/T4SS family [Shewanella xiamenensis]MDI5833293.1 ATPase, T2SS/T4P/T4SS family [Shewanella xiamenensis]WHF57957.1 ATPase, T2SS/T4P/T4SS family [Shewanella xiamenensis]
MKNNSKDKFMLPVVPKYQPEDIASILKHLESAGKFSDLYLASERPISIKVDGEPFAVSRKSLDHEEVRGFLNYLTKDETAHIFIATGMDIDENSSIPTGIRNDYYRYRLNASSFTIPDKGRGINITLRTLSQVVPSLEEIKLDSRIAQSLMPEQGLVLVCGATGSGKSTTIASSIKYCVTRNEKDENGEFSYKGKVILTYEDPIEYIHNYHCENGTLIFQASVGERGDVKSFKQGLKNALRRAPNYIVVGELRDEESVDIALQICNSAHTCISSLHAADISAVFDRLAGYYPAQVQTAKVIQILQSIRTCMVQSLAPKLGGGRHMLKEYLEFNNEVIDSITDELQRKGIDNLKHIIKGHVAKYGITMSQSAKEAFDSGLISNMTLLTYCEV